MTRPGKAPKAIMERICKTIERNARAPVARLGKAPKVNPAKIRWTTPRNAGATMIAVGKAHRIREAIKRQNTTLMGEGQGLRIDLWPMEREEAQRSGGKVR